MTTTATDDLSTLADIAGGDSRVVRSLTAAETRRRTADADSERRLRERAARVRLEREEREARREEAARSAEDRAALRDKAREAKAARKTKRRAAQAAWIAARTEYARNNAVKLYCGLIYAQAVGGAVYGQVTNTALGPLLIRIVIAVAIEGLGLAMALTAQQQRLAGERALAARVLTWLSALTAAGINLAGHWDKPKLAVVLAVLSMAGIVVFEIRSGAKHRKQLRELGMIPPPPTQFGWRRWLRYPRSTWRAWSLDIRDRLSDSGAALLARVERGRAAQQREKACRQVADLARKAARKAARKGDAGAALAALVRLAATGTPATAPAITAHPVAAPVTVPMSGHPDTASGQHADTAADNTGHANRTPEADTPRAAVRPRSRSSKRTAAQDTAAKIARLRDRHPDMTQEDIAKRAGVSTRTVRRHDRPAASSR